MKRIAPPAAMLVLAAILAACSGTEATLKPQSGDDAATATPLTPGTAAQTATPAVNAAMSVYRIQFAPIVGSTVDAITPLSRRLSLRARERGLKLVPVGDPATTHLVKGYFSALPEGPETTIIYVFDVFDAANNRLHRIQGQEKTPAAGTSADPWAGVPSSLMESVADRVISELSSVLATA